MGAMSINQKEHLRQIHEENLIDEHYGFGLWVRNLLGHWVPPMNGDEYASHPDNISGVITKLVWRKLHDLA
jgi:hypothetical protein